MTQQKSTEINKIDAVNKATGLTPLQEQAIVLLLSGNNVSSVANQLSIDRGTIYQWQEKENFQAFYNSLQKKIKFETESGLMGMFNDAIQSVKNCLNSDNEQVRLKAAIWLIEEIKSKQIGQTDPRLMIKGKCTENSFNIDFGTHLNESEYQKLLKENNLK